MKTATSRLASVIGAGIATLCMAASTAVSADSVSDRELEVIEAMAAILNRDASESYDYLYFESDFSAGSHALLAVRPGPHTVLWPHALRGAIAGHRTRDGQREAVEFDKSAAKQAGLRIGHKKLPRFRYLMLSRVIFAPDNQRAWVAVDLNGETGAIMRLDKIDGQWNKTHRCGGWVKAPE